MEAVTVLKMRTAQPGRRRTRYFKPRSVPAISDLGSRTTSLQCSECDALLFERVDADMVRGLRVLCPHCGAISVA